MLAINCLQKRAFRPLRKGTKTNPDADCQYPSCAPPPDTHTCANTHVLLVVSPRWLIRREAKDSAKQNSLYSVAEQFLQQPQRHVATEKGWPSRLASQPRCALSQGKDRARGERTPSTPENASSLQPFIALSLQSPLRPPTVIHLPWYRGNTSHQGGEHARLRTNKLIDYTGQRVTSAQPARPHALFRPGVLPRYRDVWESGPTRARAACCYLAERKHYKITTSKTCIREHLHPPG